MTVVDRTGPSISGVPADVTVECDAIPDPAEPTASDNCDNAPTLEFTHDEDPGSCADASSITRTWTATDACGNVTVEEQVLTVDDTTAPVVTALLEPSVPLPAASANSAASVCTPASVRDLRVVCAATDNCDGMPTLSAKLIATQHEVDADQACTAVVTEIDVLCDEVIELELLAAPCAASGPQSARPATSVRSDGVRIVYGESVMLEVRGEDACQNVGVATFDPATEPSTLCDEVLVDGTCCPAVGQPASDCSTTSENRRVARRFRK